MITALVILKLALVLVWGKCAQGLIATSATRNSFHPSQGMYGIRAITNPNAISSRSTTRMNIIPEVSSSITESSTVVLGLETLFTNENIKKAFSVGTFGPQLLWLLMILAPKANITKTVMGGYTGIILFSLVHLFVVAASLNQQDGTAPIMEFKDVFDASSNADPQKAMMGMMKYPNFVTEEWTHVLTWDLFVGRWIWLDGLKRNIFTAHSVLFCNLIGPPGLLLHFLTSLISARGLPPSEEVVEIEKL